MTNIRTNNYYFQLVTYGLYITFINAGVTGLYSPKHSDIGNC